MSTYQLIQGDALIELQKLPSCSVDCIVTDPPYASTGEAGSATPLRQNRISPTETQFYEAWLRDHIQKWKRILKPTGAVWLTCDWRGAVCIENIACRIGFKRPKVGVWYRKHIGFGHILRNTYECFLILVLPKWQRKRTDESDVWECEWSPNDRKFGHPAEKPIGLMKRGCDLICSPGGIVLDPFMGSGTTGVAALQGGYEFIGIEQDADYFETANKRIEETSKGQPQLALPINKPCQLEIAQ